MINIYFLGVNTLDLIRISSMRKMQIAQNDQASEHIKNLVAYLCAFYLLWY